MKLPKWAVAVLIVSLLLNIKTSLDIVSMKNEMRNLQNSVNSISFSLQNSVSNSMNRIDEMLKKEVSLVNEFKYEFLSHKDKRIDYMLTLKPKVYNEGEKLSFLLKAGENSPELIPAETKDNVYFTAKVNMSIFDAADIDLVIEDGKTKKTEKLDSIYPAVEKLATGIDYHILGGSMRYGKGSLAIVMDYGFELVEYPKPENITPALQDVTLNIEVNGKVFNKFPMEWNYGSGSGRHYIKLTNYKIPCKAGDNILIYATARDDNGLNYKCHMESWTIKENGEIGYASPDFPHGKIDIY